MQQHDKDAAFKLSQMHPLELLDTNVFLAKLEILVMFFKEQSASEELNSETFTAVQVALKEVQESGLMPIASLTVPPSVCKSERPSSGLKLLNIILEIAYLRQN